jgi:hypothetical protein
MLTARRQSIKTLAMALAAAGTIAAAPDETGMPIGPNAMGGHTLDAFTKRLAKLPRRRDFRSAPMILDHRELWDAEALDAVIHYAGSPKQSYDNTDLFGGWLNVMRNAMNTEIWSFGHVDFLVVSATHGPAHLALYDDFAWEKYGLAKLAGSTVTRNTFVGLPAGVEFDSKDFQNHNGPYSPLSNSLQGLQQRGAVILACHNAIWELSERLRASGNNPDKLTTDALCGELSNHLIAGVVLTPGAVGTLVELDAAGFTYAR